jgi:hypothetical protein
MFNQRNRTMLQDNYGNLISSLVMENDKRIVLLVMDGIGDCDNDGRGTALQLANTPNMDELAIRSALGQHLPVATAVTPGSGPGHLGLFGFDPLVYKVGRGILSALGIEFPVTPRDVAARMARSPTAGPDGLAMMLTNVYSTRFARTSPIPMAWRCCLKPSPNTGR